MLSLPSIALGLLAATHILRNGVVATNTILRRSTDVTCGGKYPKAGDGFAQRPDGCSSITGNPGQVRDKWGSANFGTVCDDHDRCYYTVGSNVDACNNNFCDGLGNACDHAYCKVVPLLGRQCVPGLHDACKQIANTYCGFVKAGQKTTPIYADAQSLQKGYEACIKENGGIEPPKPSGCGSGHDEGAYWEVKIPGVRCTVRAYECFRGEIVRLSDRQLSECTEI